MSEKASVYLTVRCETFERLLEFFLNKNTGYCRSLNDKRATFLSQIDFWDWELDNLIYSFETFAERSKNWDSATSMAQSIIFQGLSIRNSVLNDLSEKRYRRDHLGRTRLKDNGDLVYEEPKDRPKTVAPVAKLNGVIEKWHELLDICEKDIMTRQTSLDKFRKKKLPC